MTGFIKGLFGIAVIGGLLWIATVGLMLHVSNVEVSRYHATQEAWQRADYCARMAASKPADEIDQFMFNGQPCSSRIAHGGGTD